MERFIGARGEIDRTHATAPQLANDLVAANLLTDDRGARIGFIGFDQTNIDECGLLNEVARRFVRGQERQNFHA